MSEDHLITRKRQAVKAQKGLFFERMYQVASTRVTLSDLRLITMVHGQRQERLLASEEDYRRALAELIGIGLQALHQS